LKALHTDAALIPTLPANLVENAAPLASLHEIAKQTQRLAHRNDGPLVKCMLDAIDTEALGRAYTYKNRVAELEKQPQA
jgi:hypothetical protein